MTAPNPETAYRQARDRLATMEGQFTARAKQSDADTATADDRIARKVARLRALIVLVSPLLWIALLPVVPAWLMVVALVLPFLGSAPLEFGSISQSSRRLRWAHTDRLLLGGPALFSLVLVLMLLCSPRMALLGSGALQVGEQVKVWAECVQDHPSEAAPCSNRLAQRSGAVWTETTTASRHAFWRIESPLLSELDRLVSTTLEGAAVAVVPNLFPTLDAQRERVTSGWAELRQELERAETTAVLAAIEAGAADLWAMARDAWRRPVLWGLAVLAVVWVQRVPVKLVQWLLGRREPVTYLSERQSVSAKRRARRVHEAMVELEQRWQAQKASRSSSDSGDWLASFLLRRAAFAVAGAAVGVVLGPALALFGGLVELADAADGLDGLTDLGDGLTSVDPELYNDPSQFTALADAVVATETDPFLLDVDGDGLADQTVEGTSVHWTDGYQRADGTWVRGYYATDPDGIVFNNLSYLRMRG